MITVDLVAKVREAFGKEKTKKLRAEGLIPAVVYTKGKESKSILVNSQEFRKTLRSHAGRNSLYNIKIDKDTTQAVITDWQVHPLTDEIEHVDFYEIRKNEPVKLSVPIAIHGTPVGGKRGGDLTHKIRKVKLSVVAEHLPEKIELDVSNLDVNQAITIADLPIPEGGKVLDLAPEAVIVTVLASRKTEAAAAAPADAKAADAKAAPAKK